MIDWIIICGILSLVLVNTKFELNRSRKEVDRLFIKSIRLGSRIEYLTGEEVEVWESVKPNSRQRLRKLLDQSLQEDARSEMTIVERIWKWLKRR